MTPTQALLSAIERDVGGVAVVWCPDLGLRDWLIEEVAGLAALGASPLQVSSVDDALGAPHRMVLLVPNNERAVVEELEGRRDQLLDPARTQPVVLFLMRDGDGREELARSPSLSSWIRGSDVDPDQLAEIDAEPAHAQFERETGRSVEDWLRDWRAGAIAQTGETFARAYWAALLERS